MAIKDWPETERPREKLLRDGAAALSDAELLAIIIGFSSNVVGGKTSLNSFELSSPIKLEKVKDHFKAEMPKTMQQLVAQVID